MNGCGCNYWRELIKSAWGLATTSVRAVKTRDDIRYPDGDGMIDISGISGGDGTVTSVNSKTPDDRGAVTVTGADITTPATGTTIDESISVLHNLVSQEQSARSAADRNLEATIGSKQDVLTEKQQNAVDSGVTAQKIAKYDAYDAQIISNSNAIKTSSDDIAQLKISDSEHTSAISDMGTQIDAQATEISGIKAKDASQDSDISTLKTKTSSHDTEIQGLSESVVSDLTGTFTESTRTLSLSLERESAPSIDCSVIIPEGTGGAVTSVNGKTGTVTLGASDVLTTTQVDAVMSGITAPRVKTYDGYSSKIASKADSSTVTQIQTTMGGCFNDASISGNQLVLGTVGGQQNTLALPGGTSLPTSGFYWERLTSWPTDWTPLDIIMIYCPGTLGAYAPSWTGRIQFDPSMSESMGCVITSLKKTSITPYWVHPDTLCITINMAKIPSYDDMNDPDISNVLTLTTVGFNNANCMSKSFSTITKDDMIESQLIYRLRKFT